MKENLKESTIQINNPQIQKYAENMTSPESNAIQNIVKCSDEELEYIDMLSGKLVVGLLKILIQTSGVKRILEIGTFTGYSALSMAEALPDEGELVTIEMNERFQELAEKHFQEYDVNKKIRLIKGDAREFISTLDGEFDLVFLDADKQSYPLYFEKSMEILKSGGLLVADNVLWDGTVLTLEDHKAQAIHKFNEQVAADDRVEQVLLPFRDGVSLIRKK